MATPKSTVVATPALTVQTKATSAPAVSLVTPSTTQVPTHIVNSYGQTCGEEPLYLVHMKDGTYAYLKESLLTQSGAVVVV